MIFWFVSIAGRSFPSIASCHQLNETGNFNYDSPPCLLSIFFFSARNPSVEQANRETRHRCSTPTRALFTTINKHTHTRNMRLQVPLTKRSSEKKKISLFTYAHAQNKVAGLTKPHSSTLSNAHS